MLTLLILVTCFSRVDSISQWILGGVADPLLFVSTPPSLILTSADVSSSSCKSVGVVGYWKCSWGLTPFDFLHTTQIWCWLKCLDLGPSSSSSYWLLTDLRASTDWVSAGSKPLDPHWSASLALGQPCSAGAAAVQYGIRISRFQGLVLHQMECLALTVARDPRWLPSVQPLFPLSMLDPLSTLSILPRALATPPPDCPPSTQLYRSFCVGSSSSNDRCQQGLLTLICTPPDSLCGDGQIQDSQGETCDDGNRLAGDGCSPTCNVEPHFQCTAASPCSCAAGYTGPDCRDCASDAFGPLCLPCSCDPEVSLCDSGIRGTGTCLCLPGHIGPDCSECDTGWWRNSGNSSCVPCGPGMCGPMGTCLDGGVGCSCQQGWSGPQCDVGPGGGGGNTHPLQPVVCDPVLCGPTSDCDMAADTGGIFVSSPILPSPTMRCVCKHGYMGNTCSLCNVNHVGPECEACSYCSSATPCVEVPSGQNVQGRRVWQTPFTQTAYVCQGPGAVTPGTASGGATLVGPPMVMMSNHDVQPWSIQLGPRGSTSCLVVASTLADAQRFSSRFCQGQTAAAWGWVEPGESLSGPIAAGWDQVGLFGTTMAPALLLPRTVGPLTRQLSWLGADVSALGASDTVPQGWTPVCASGSGSVRGYVDCSDCWNREQVLLTDALCPESCWCVIPSALPVPVLDAQRWSLRWSDTLVLPELERQWISTRREWQVVARTLSSLVRGEVRLQLRSPSALTSVERQELLTLYNGTFILA